MPLVSVIMPAYNAEKTVGEAILSVCRQTFSDFELIVINDCSRDGTAAVIKALAERDERILFVENESNSGVSHTRNRGVAMARGEWIAFLDSDDMWEEDKLARQLSLLAETEGVLSYTASSFIDEDGKHYGYVMAVPERVDYKTLMKGNFVSCSSVVIKAAVMKGIAMPGDAMHEDYYVWLRVLKEHPYAYGVNEPLLVYRLSANSKSSSRIKSANMLFNTYRASGYGRISSFFFVFRYFFYSVKKRKNIYRSGKEEVSGK